MSDHDHRPSIRRARHGDLDAVADLERTALADPWSRQALETALDDRDHGRLWVAVAGTPPRPVAYACARLVADEAELLRVAVSDERRRQGLGAALLERLLARLAEDGARACHLEVAAGNAPAIALYRRLGFRRTGRRPGYYPGAADDVQDALLMRRDLA